MIPWKMWFSGIRDYAPTYMDLSGQEEHVLITGPNGAGKSTITYCMGAVLYSSKVELEGLRSRNLAADEPWKAQIRLLFKNGGRLRIDAPDYIEFSLRVLQEPGQPVKKEFVVSSGDDPESWDGQTRYTSGDRQYNFTSYKQDLQYKYKIDPDLFYLIWYQQEVNQFAVMHPEERFRIFAEMHGIDQVQRNWEESLEKLKDTQETLRSAEINVANKKQLVKIKKSDLERYEDNRRRLVEGGQLYARSLLQLEAYYNREQESQQRLMEQLDLDLELQQEQIAEVKQQEHELGIQLEDTKQQIEQQRLELGEVEEQLHVLDQIIQETKTAIAELELELQQVNKEKERITRTDAEVEHGLETVAAELAAADRQRAELRSVLDQSRIQEEQHRRTIYKLENTIEQEYEQETVHQSRLREYNGSYAVQQELDRLDRSLQQAKDHKHEYVNSIKQLREELARLQEQRDWSSRQSESLALLSSSRIKAYPLSELVELDRSAQAKEEERFNAIKYTVFFDGIRMVPPNDLYHVPLRKVVPERSVTELPELQLRVKEDVSEDMLPHAMKALWWVGEFFKAVDPRIEDSVLVDRMGLRGPQEAARYILSARALLARKDQISELIGSLADKTAELEVSILRDTKRLQELNSVIQLVREAEAFRTKEHERVSRRLKLKQEQTALEELLKQIQALEESRETLLKQHLELEHLQRALQREAEFYVRLGQQKAKYEELGGKQQELQNLKGQVRKLRQQRETGEEGLNQAERLLRRQEHELLENEYRLGQERRKLEQIGNQLQTAADVLENAQGERVGCLREIEDFQQLHAALYNEAEAEAAADDLPRLSLPQIRTALDKGQTEFNNARNESGIDPAAPDNYKVIEAEFSRIQEDYKRTEILFEQNQERTQQLKDQLETTINMRVLEILQNFRSYMSLFQFEGEIDWDYHEDRRGRTHFNLYIKARKEGHRGTLEDVSLKARGGRVGKGVSGGEESLSSLLFALALLQNLQTSPGFIVLDEFDSALDEQRKLKVFELYARELKRKLVILTPKSHEKSYLDRFSKSYVVHHDPTVPRSKVAGLIKKG
ncbi:AAA family ATPase [Paenibacillus donghaensis]|uniref:Nuclease SbcCD subunit C n=1 Tax=Paenibacillus donghaensis TaxID=414771 RepID=A0A2Z2KIS9_9BACL|nr:AAA family ATPase [Paenibacillus donghaensis]ASA25837.1 chromosome segregation protein SMC [Paenibacillus donghaensis]